MKNDVTKEMHFDNFSSHINVSRETFDQLSVYHDHLQKWQASINLVSPTTLNDVWSRHIIDSAQIAPLIEEKDRFLIDLGSGAGLPGVVLAIMGCRNVHLIESDTRKSVFLREISRILDLKISIHNERVENLIFSDVGYITARAFASLDDLCHFSLPFLSQDTICFFPKGKNYDKEVERAQKNWGFNCHAHPSKTDSSAVILEITQLQSR